jgi:hypothetical protein
MTEVDEVKFGFIIISRSRAYEEGIVYLDYTTREPFNYLKKLNDSTQNTGVPWPFNFESIVKITERPNFKENLEVVLDKHRINKKKKFYKFQDNILDKVFDLCKGVHMIYVETTERIPKLIEKYPTKLKNTESPGFVYALQNDSYANLEKIGFTTRNVIDRCNDLNSKVVLTPFQPIEIIKTETPFADEQKIHKILKDGGYHVNKEFYGCPAAIRHSVFGLLEGESIMVNENDNLSTKKCDRHKVSKDSIDVYEDKLPNNLLESKTYEEIKQRTKARMEEYNLLKKDEEDEHERDECHEESHEERDDTKKVSRKSKKAYADEEIIFNYFYKTNCIFIPDKNVKVNKTKLIERFTEWCIKNECSNHNITKTKITRLLKSKGIKVYPNDQNYYGLKI